MAPPVTIAPFTAEWRSANVGDQAQGTVDKALKAIHQVVGERGVVAAADAEHGVGVLKRGELQKYASPVALSTMRALKTALDPKGIMNPGKVLSD